VSFEVLTTPSSDAPTKLKANKRKPRAIAQSKTLEFTLAQDKTALRTRKGDTGSILWRVRWVLTKSLLDRSSHISSIELAQLILQQYYSQESTALLDRSKLADAHVLELGSVPFFYPSALHSLLMTRLD
jgi:protein N-lysine methyltransferase METTL21D